MKMAYIGVALGVAGGFRTGEIAYTGPYVGDPTYPKAKAEDHRHFTTDLVFESPNPRGRGSVYLYTRRSKNVTYTAIRLRADPINYGFFKDFKRESRRVYTLLRTRY